MTPEAIANVLGRPARKANDGYMAQCPCHDDGTASLSIDVKDGGGILVKCFAGCDNTTIIETLKGRGLWPDTPKEAPPKKRKIVETYGYIDPSGHLIFQAVRYEPKGFSQRRPDGKGGWVYNSKGVETVPYNLPAVIAAETVFVVEGEKDAERLKTLGIVATCNPMGAGKWRKSFNRYFPGKKVVILPDNDVPGRKHAMEVAQHLHGTAAAIKIVELPGLPAKGDVSDWLQVGGNDKVALRSIIKATGEWKSPEEKAVLEQLPAVDFFNAYELPTQKIDDLLSEMRMSWSFVKFSTPQLKYSPALGYLAYDGRRYISNPAGGPNPHFERFLKEAYVQAMNGQNSSFRPELLKGLSKLETRTRRSAILELAESNPDFLIQPHELDADPMLLNAQNGTVDLRTGTLRAHSIDDRITRIVNVEYNPGARCPLFLQFLDKIFAGNMNLIGYVRRFFGYCLSGSTREQVLLFMYGTGANGKTTFLALFLKLLADFALSAPADLLMHREQPNTSNELARLMGARLVAVNEVPEGSRLDEARTKTITGGDTVTARFLYQEFFEYTPQFKLIMVGNHKPVVKGRDLGIWRRIHLLPFSVTVTPEERDPQLTDKLLAELPGILSWAVLGCLEWQKIGGLKPPPEVSAAVEEYRDSEDVFGQWLRECCEKGPGRSKPKDLLTSFIEFSGWRHITDNKLGRMLTEAGFDRYSDGCQRYWIGIELKDKS